MSQKTKDAVSNLHSKFVYKKDSKFLGLFDKWAIMRDNNGVYRGDCEDFSLTVIWHICNKNIFLFILNFLILHRYRIYYSKTKDGYGHAVGYANGLYFDNYGKEALPKKEFLALREHKLWYFTPSPMMWLQFIGGMFK